MDPRDVNGLSDADYANIGRVVVEATAIEDLVHIAMRVLMKDQWLADLIGADVQWSWRHDRTCLLIDAFITDPDERERARSWMNRANDLLGRRNRIVHTHWMAGSVDGEPVVAGSKRTARGRKSNMPGRPLRDAAARIDDVERLVQELSGLRESWFRDLYGPSMVARGNSD